MTEDTLTFATPENVPEPETQTLELLQKMEITSAPELKAAVGWTAEIKDKMAEVTAERDSFLKPLKDVTKRLSDKYKPAIDSLKACEAATKKAVTTYVQTVEAYQKKALSEGDVEKAQEVEVPKVKGMSLRRKLKVEVTDAKALVDYCIENGYVNMLLPNVEAMEKMAQKDLLGDTPGLRVVEDITVAITASKVER